MVAVRQGVGGARLALIGEARGEFLFLRMVGQRVRELHGEDAVIQVELDPSDLSDDERRQVLVPRLTDEFAAAAGGAAHDLPARIAAAERDYGVASLARLWRSDLAFWRDGVPEERLARDALGYLACFDALFASNPRLAGGFAEESGRLIKRAFRAVARSHGRRMLIGHPIPLPDRLVFVDQEELHEGLPPYETFAPSADQLAYAAQLIDRVVDSELQFAEPRDLSLTPARVGRFVQLARKQLRRDEPGAANVHLGTFMRDYLVQRSRVALLRRTSVRRPTGERLVFYPLHGAGDSQITIRGDAYRDQLALVDLLAASLPFGYRLLVKPHPIYAGELELIRLRALRRRRSNVDLVDASVHAHELLKRVQAVVCVNSTTGFEALMFGVPLVTLGRSLYRGRGLTLDVVDPAQLPALLAEAVRSEGAPRESVERLVAYLYAVSDEVTPIYRDLGRDNARRFGEVLSTRLVAPSADRPPGEVP